MLIGFLIKLAGTVMDLAIPWILAHMIDEVVPTGDRGAIFLWGIAMAACAVIALLGNVIANRRASRYPGMPHGGSVMIYMKRSNIFLQGSWTK